jgi:hypothetical protein
MVYGQATPAERRDDSDMSVLRPLQFAVVAAVSISEVPDLLQFAVAGQLWISTIRALTAAWNGLPGCQRTGCSLVSSTQHSYDAEIRLKSGY